MVRCNIDSDEVSYLISRLTAMFNLKSKMQAEFKTLEIWVDSSFLSVTQINDHNHEGTYQAVWRKSVFDALRLFSIRRKYRLARLL